jgi:hypothetical protein
MANTENAPKPSGNFAIGQNISEDKNSMLAFFYPIPMEPGVALPKLMVMDREKGLGVSPTGRELPSGTGGLSVKVEHKEEGLDVQRENQDEAIRQLMQEIGKQASKNEDDDEQVRKLMERIHQSTTEMQKNQESIQKELDRYQVRQEEIKLCDQQWKAIQQELGLDQQPQGTQQERRHDQWYAAAAGEGV